MKETIQQLLSEYTRLRLNGLGTKEAIQALHPHLQDMRQENREKLARAMRAWEGQRTLDVIAPEERERLAKAAEERSKHTIRCPKCDTLNQSKDIVCRVCGTILQPDAHDTAVLSLPTTEQGTDLHFAPTDTLLLIPGNEHNPFELRPQLMTDVLTLGRAREGEILRAGVNLERVGAHENGVSRLHAAIEYDSLAEVVYIRDLNSTNGTYINGQKLYANERGALRNGDRLRIGNLSFTVSFRTDPTS